VQLVLICGGRGTRLPGRAAGLPKSMVALAGRPLLAHLLERLLPLHGSAAAPVVVAAADDPQVPAFIAEALPAARIVRQPAPDGVASALLLTLPLLAGPVLVALGDLVLLGSLDAPPPAPALVVWPEAPPAAISANFGVRDDGALLEKPADPRGLLCGLGLYLLTPAVIAGFATAPRNPRTGELEITAALEHVRPTTQFARWPFHGRYINVNDAADLAAAEAALT